MMKHLLNQLPFTDRRELTSLVEHRRAYSLQDFELNVYETYQESKLVPLHFSDLVVINMLKGKKVMHMGSSPRFDYLPGETVIVPPLVSMHIDFPEASEEDPTQCTALAISHQKIQAILGYLNEYFPRTFAEGGWKFQLEHYHFLNDAELAKLTDKLFAISISGEMHKDILADLTLKELLIRIMQTQSLISIESCTTKSGSRLHAVTSYILEHIHEHITIESLSQKAHMSKPSLFRSFKEELGISPMEYVIRARINNAKRVLQYTRNIKEACYASGFNNMNYFVRMFRRQEGMTPGAYLMMS